MVKDVAAVATRSARAMAGGLIPGRSFQRETNMNKVDRGVFVCAWPDCGEQVSGIYCDAHRSAWVAGRAAARRFQGGDTVQFVWYGVEREGTVEKVNRINLKVIVELDGKRKILSLPIVDCFPKEAAIT